MNKKMIAGLAALAALTVACGSGAEVAAGGAGAGDAAVADKTRKPVAVAMGKPIVVDSEGLQATYTLSKAEIRTSGEYGLKPDNGAWVLAFLRVEVTKGETFACSCELSLVQKDGKVRDQSVMSFEGKVDFESVDLKAGQNTDGWVAFDLPKKEVNGSTVQLKISSLFSDSAYGYWTVKA